MENLFDRLFNEMWNDILKNHQKNLQSSEESMDNSKIEEIWKSPNGYIRIVSLQKNLENESTELTIEQLEKKLSNLVQGENYEEAAKIRDLIKQKRGN